MRLPPPGDQEEFYAQMLSATRTDAERACIMLLWRTGMHASTLCDQSYLIEGTAITWFRPAKGRDNRPMLAAQMLKSEIEVLRRCLAAGTLPTNKRTLARWVRCIGARAGIAGCCPLTLRHSRAVFLLDSGMSINRVASLLGCSWSVLEKNYAQIEQARLVK